MSARLAEMQRTFQPILVMSESNIFYSIQERNEFEILDLVNWNTSFGHIVLCNQSFIETRLSCRTCSGSPAEIPGLRFDIFYRWSNLIRCFP